MKIAIQTNKLQAILPPLNRVVSTKSQLPILSHFLLEAKDKIIQLSSTDLEIGIQTNITGEIMEEGSLTIPAKTFSEFIALLSEEDVSIETKDGAVEVVTKKTRSSFQTMIADDFPKLYEERGEVIASLPVKELRDTIAPVIFSASIDSARPALSGVLVKREASPEGGGFLLVATDGYRLSMKHYMVAKERIKKEKEDISLIVPARVFREVLAIKDGGEDVSLFVSSTSNQILFELGKTTLVGRLIGDEYPNYDRILPVDSATKVSFEREKLLKAVKMCSVFARDTANIVKFDLKKDVIVVSSKTPSLGENTVEVEAKLTGEENEIAFNVRYLLDVLSNITAEQMVFEMLGPLNPGVFKIAGDDSFLHLIMPIRIQQ